MVGLDAVVSDEWWFVSSWTEMCMMCKRLMSFMRGWIGC